MNICKKNTLGNALGRMARFTSFTQPLIRKIMFALIIPKPRLASDIA